MGKPGVHIISLLYVYLYLLAGQADGQNYTFHNFNSDNELSQPYVYSILQDQHGYLWIGTGNGLSKYDGWAFENYTLHDSLADNFITCGINSGNDLLFGHMNGRITIYRNHKFRKITSPGMDLTPVTHFALSPAGQIWFSTYADGLFMLNPTHDLFEAKSLKDPPAIHTFEFSDAHRILLGTSSGLMSAQLTSSDEISSIISVQGIPEAKITGIQKKRNGSGFYIATENEGLYLLSIAGSTFHVTQINPGLNADLTGIQGIVEDSQGNLWLATIGHGMIKITSPESEVQQITIFNKAGGFSTDNVKTVFEDREGLIWSGNYGDGLTQITPKPFSLETFDKTQYGNNISAIYVRQPYRWIGTERGLLKADSYTGKILKFYGRKNGLPEDIVTALYSADGNNLWIGTLKNGLFYLNNKNGKIDTYPIGNSSMENAITRIAGSKEIVWIGTRMGLCQIRTTDHRKRWYTINQGGLPHNFINSVYLDRKGVLWVSTNSSTLAYIKNDKVHRIELSQGTGVMTLGEVTEDSSSRIWVSSFGDGVFLINQDSIINLNTTVGLLSNYCYSIVCDDMDNIWVGHRGGLSRIRTSDFIIKAIHDHEDIPEDCQFNRNAILRDNQRILLGSDKGLYTYDRSLELPQRRSPLLVITSIRINDEEKNLKNDLIELPPGSYKIRIEFMGVSLKEPSLVSYQFKMEGYDQWSEITKKRDVTYDHLTYGSYRFILKAVSGDGEITLSPLMFNITIREPIWRKAWFYSGAALLVVILIFVFIKWRFHRFIIEKTVLEDKVHKRTQEIEQQKDELARQRDLIERKNASITSSILYASQIQNAIFPPSEYIDKLLPDSFILNLPKDIVSGDFFWLANKDDKIVVTVADCTGHGVPGSFMSLLGITLINEIVNVLGIVQSDEIVTTLRDKVIQSLQQNRKNITTSDGMDIALCVMNQRKHIIEFSGGMNDLVFIHNGTLQVLEADHISVSVLYSDFGKFSKKEIKYQKGDVIYLSSDGFQDQFGGTRDKKFMRQRFYNLLLEIHQYPMADQKEILRKRLDNWKGSTIQTDDITVMGIRL